MAADPHLTGSHRPVDTPPPEHTAQGTMEERDLDKEAQEFTEEEMERDEEGHPSAGHGSPRRCAPTRR